MEVLRSLHAVFYHLEYLEYLVAVAPLDALICSEFFFLISSLEF